MHYSKNETNAYHRTEHTKEQVIHTQKIYNTDTQNPKMY